MALTRGTGSVYNVGVHFDPTGNPRQRLQASDSPMGRLSGLRATAGGGPGLALDRVSRSLFKAAVDSAALRPLDASKPRLSNACKAPAAAAAADWHRKLPAFISV